MPIWQLCANLLIPNCLRSNLSYSPLAALELCVNMSNSNFYDLIIQNQSKSLWKTRDRIAHAAINISKEDYDKYKPAADYFLLSISQSLQPINEYKAKLKRKRVK